MAFRQRIYYALACDGCGDPFEDDHVEIADWDKDRLLISAEYRGWSVADGRHLCPDCQAGGIGCVG